MISRPSNDIRTTATTTRNPQPALLRHTDLRNHAQRLEGDEFAWWVDWQQDHNAGGEHWKNGFAVAIAKAALRLRKFVLGEAFEQSVAMRPAIGSAICKEHVE